MTKKSLPARVKTAITNLDLVLTEVRPEYPGLTISIRVGTTVICGNAIPQIEALDTWPATWAKPRPELMNWHRIIGREIISVISPIISSITRANHKKVDYLRIVIDSETDTVYIPSS
ncbi:MAG: hypothetical protein WCG48_03195 [Candidatus Berkelbacteria bacterium]